MAASQHNFYSIWNVNELEKAGNNMWFRPSLKENAVTLLCTLNMFI